LERFLTEENWNKVVKMVGLYKGEDANVAMY
jgi:hypothetical protein